MGLQEGLPPKKQGERGRAAVGERGCGWGGRSCEVVVPFGAMSGVSIPLGVRHVMVRSTRCSLTVVHGQRRPCTYAVLLFVPFPPCIAAQPSVCPASDSASRSGVLEWSLGPAFPEQQRDTPLHAPRRLLLLCTNTAHSSTAMAQTHDEILTRIRKHVADARAVQDDAMDFDASRTESRLEQTVKELQQRVQEQQAALETVCYR